jgi:hypothetical protein
MGVATLPRVISTGPAPPHQVNVVGKHGSSAMAVNQSKVKHPQIKRSSRKN